MRKSTLGTERHTPAITAAFVRRLSALSGAPILPPIVDFGLADLDAVTADSRQRTAPYEELDLAGRLVAETARVFRRDVFAFFLKRGGRRIRVGILNEYRIAKVQRSVDPRQMVVFAIPPPKTRDSEGRRCWLWHELIWVCMDIDVYAFVINDIDDDRFSACFANVDLRFHADCLSIN